MKPSTHQLFLSAAIAIFFTLALATFAEDTPPPAPSTPAPEAEKSAPAATPPADQPAAPTPVATPAPEPAAGTTASAVPAETAEPAKNEPAKTEPANAESTSTEKPKLRRLDEPSSGEQPTPTRRNKRVRVHPNHGNEVVNFGHDATLAKGQKADAVVAILGSATSEGEVQDAVVSVMGNTRVTGPVGDAAVAVFGNTYVNSKVGDAVVAVFGSVELGPDAEVGGDVVAVGGTVKRDPKAVIHGHVNNVSFGGVFSDTEWLRSWFVNCALYGRLLGFGPHLMWAWWIALGFLGFYLLITVLFGKGVEKCAETLEQRPGSSILAALLTVLLAPVATIILICTGIGIAVVPFLAAGLFFAGLFGKAVMLVWLGRRFTRLFGIDSPVLAVLIGGVIVLGLYTVPFLSIIVYKLLGWIGLGVVVYTLLLNMKSEKKGTPPMVPPSPGAPMTDASGLTLAPALVVPGAAVPPVASAATLPRAGFWIRVAAVMIDCVLLGILVAFIHTPGNMGLLALAVYGACMWRLRGSTIGGIICGLKVVRLDDRELDWATAIVRALSCFLSLVLLGLGFIWVAFDDQKQSWHDKIAGTVVVHVPKGMSLL